MDAHPGSEWPHEDRVEFAAILAASGLTDTPAPPQTTRDPAPAPAASASVRPEFPLRHLLPVGLAMTVLMTAVGQILFWRRLFGDTTTGTLGAVAVAAAFEVLMIGGTDKALDYKSKGSPWWKLLFPSGALAAAVSAGAQLLHWPAAMGTPLAAASLLGWGSHAISGWIRAQHYRTEIAPVADIAPVGAIEVEDESGADPVPKDKSEPTRPEPKPDTTAPRTTPAQQQKPKLDAVTARRWSIDNGRPGPTKVRTHFAEQGYHVPSVSNLRRWLNKKEGE